MVDSRGRRKEVKRKYRRTGETKPKSERRGKVKRACSCHLVCSGKGNAKDSAAQSIPAPRAQHTEGKKAGRANGRKEGPCKPTAPSNGGEDQRKLPVRRRKSTGCSCARSCVLSCGESCCLFFLKPVCLSVKGKGSWSVSPVCVVVQPKRGQVSADCEKRAALEERLCVLVCCVCVPKCRVTKRGAP